jgi:2-polyprenyl-3-methyl-5-hydroxy-6-metoxy-1,4-benzoquinol methylase
MSADLDSWDKAASGWDRDIARPGSYRTHLITQAMEQLLPELLDKRVLDAGCGNGYFTNWLKNKGARAEGVDGSSEMVRIAKSTYPDMDFKVADLTQTMPHASGEYDFIVANMLLMHMDNVGTFLSESYRLLKPEGKLIVSVLHPCFNEPTSQLYKSIFMKLTGKNPGTFAYDYYIGATGRYEAHMKTKLTHYHRTLETYSEKFNEAGFAISSMMEPHKLPKEFLELHPKMEYAERLPRFIFFNLIPQ